MDWVGGTLAPGPTIKAPMSVARLVSACDAVRKAPDLNTRWSIGRTIGFWGFGFWKSNPVSAYVVREVKPVRTPMLPPSKERRYVDCAGQPPFEGPSRTMRIPYHLTILVIFE